MNQIIRTTCISFGVIALLAVAGFLFIQRESAKGEAPVATIAQSENQEANGVTENPRVTAPLLTEEMNEARLQFYLHEMTHSKVHAEDKWGDARAMTQTNIEELLEIVSASDFHEKAFYRNTLEDWQSGDFSGAVDVHNTIWHWHNGTIGKATRLMTNEEEQAYIRTQF